METFTGQRRGGGTGEANGTVYKMTPSGTLTTLYSFDATDGNQPYAGVIQATDGNFYGTTVYGGTSSIGTVFIVFAVRRDFVGLCS
jgi:hypothetical protein